MAYKRWTPPTQSAQNSVSGESALSAANGARDALLQRGKKLEDVELKAGQMDGLAQDRSAKISRYNHLVTKQNVTWENIYGKHLKNDEKELEKELKNKNSRQVNLVIFEEHLRVLAEYHQLKADLGEYASASNQKSHGGKIAALQKLVADVKIHRAPAQANDDAKHAANGASSQGEPISYSKQNQRATLHFEEDENDEMLAKLDAELASSADNHKKFQKTMKALDSAQADLTERFLNDSARSEDEPRQQARSPQADSKSSKANSQSDEGGCCSCWTSFWNRFNQGGQQKVDNAPKQRAGKR